MCNPKNSALLKLDYLKILTIINDKNLINIYSSCSKLKRKIHNFCNHKKIKKEIAIKFLKNKITIFKYINFYEESFLKILGLKILSRKYNGKNVEIKICGIKLS